MPIIIAYPTFALLVAPPFSMPGCRQAGSGCGRLQRISRRRGGDTKPALLAQCRGCISISP